MLFIAETHRVKGLHQDDFESLIRDSWAPAVASEAGARLLWYFNHAHGSSISFNVVTVTGVNDWEAWGRLQDRVQSGDLQDMAHSADEMRYGVVATLLEPLPWSPMQSMDLTTRAPAGTEHERTMYIEDTIQVDAGRFDPDQAEIRQAYRGNFDPSSPGLTELTLALQPAAVAGRRGEVVLLQRVRDLGGLAAFYEEGTTAGAPWSGGHAPTSFTDTWTTRVLRTAPWSPMA